MTPVRHASWPSLRAKAVFSDDWHDVKVGSTRWINTFCEPGSELEAAVGFLGTLYPHVLNVSQHVGALSTNAFDSIVESESSWVWSNTAVQLPSSSDHAASECSKQLPRVLAGFFCIVADTEDNLEGVKDNQLPVRNKSELMVEQL